MNFFNKKIILNDNYDILIEYSYENIFGEGRDIFRRHFVLYNNNSIEFFGTGFDDYKVDGIKFNISYEEKFALINKLNENEILKLPKDISFDNTFKDKITSNFIDVDKIREVNEELIIYKENNNIRKKIKGKNSLNADFIEFVSLLNTIFFKYVSEEEFNKICDDISLELIRNGKIFVEIF